MNKLARQAISWITIICAGTLSGFAFEPPLEHLTAATFPAWRDSAHLLVVTNRYASNEIELTLLVEKPKSQDVYWNVRLNLCEATNMVAQLAVGDELIGPERLLKIGVDPAGVKAVQRFSFIVRCNSLPQSTVIFSQHVRMPRPGQEGNCIYPVVVTLNDVVNCATGGFRKGEPLFRRRR